MGKVSLHFFLKKKEGAILEKVFFFLGVFIRFLGTEPETLENGIFRRRGGSRHLGKKRIIGIFKENIIGIFLENFRAA